MMLLVAAGLLIKTFVRIQQSDFGFNSQGLLTFRTDLPAAKYKEPAQIRAFYDQLIERTRNLPGVTSAAITSETPLTTNMTSIFQIEGKTFSVRPHVHVASIGSDYFKTMQIPVISGRPFTDADREGTTPVALIDEKTKRAYFGDEDPIGKKLTFDFEGSQEKRVWRTIVGVVGGVKHRSPLENETKGEVFLPFAQEAEKSMGFRIRLRQRLFHRVLDFQRQLSIRVLVVISLQTFQRHPYRSTACARVCHCATDQRIEQVPSLCVARLTRNRFSQLSNGSRCISIPIQRNRKIESVVRIMWIELHRLLEILHRIASTPPRGHNPKIVFHFGQRKSRFYKSQRSIRLFKFSVVILRQPHQEASLSRRSIVSWNATQPRCRRIVLAVLKVILTQREHCFRILRIEPHSFLQSLQLLGPACRHNSPYIVFESVQSYRRRSSHELLP